MLVIKGLLGIIGLSSGMLVSSGLFSLVISLGIISKVADRTHTGFATNIYELAIALGGITANVILLAHITVSLPNVVLAITAGAAGMFVGCWAMAIAEVINIFPMFIRKLKIEKYLQYIILSVALGKGCGAFCIFWGGFGS